MHGNQRFSNAERIHQTWHQHQTAQRTKRCPEKHSNKSQPQHLPPHELRHLQWRHAENLQQTIVSTLLRSRNVENVVHEQVGT